MGKRVVFAVAGSGKTALIIDGLDLERRALIITYTVDNTLNLEARIREKFGCIPPNIHLMTYFKFLYSFCFIPFLGFKIRTRGITWDLPTAQNSDLRKANERHYFTPNRYIFSNRIAKLILKFSIEANVKLRLEKYFDDMFVDEVQDFAAYDFELLGKICDSSINITLVGDFHQHTFDTSRDGNYKKNLHADHDRYLKTFEDLGLTIDTTSLLKSHRCAPNVCAFLTQRLGIDIESHRNDEVLVEQILDVERANEIIDDDNIVKLFYQNATKFSCHSKNWGKSKGENHYVDVCIVLNPTTEKAFAKEFLELKEPTRNKLYVACTRARGNLYFVSQKHLAHLKN